MRILGLGKTRISGKSHSENQKVVILYCMIFLMYEIKITFSAVSLLIRAFLAGHFIRADKMIYLVGEFDFLCEYCYVMLLLWLIKLEK